MSSNLLKRQRNRLLKDNNKSNLLNNPFINNNADDDLDDDEPPTKVKIKTNDLTKYLSTSDHYINDLLQQIDKLKQRLNRIEEQHKETCVPVFEDIKVVPLLTIKYKNDIIADKYNNIVLSFLNETFKSDNNVEYNIRDSLSTIEVIEKSKSVDKCVINKNEVINIDDESPLQNYDDNHSDEQMIITDNEPVDDFNDSLICLDTTPNIICNDSTDYQYNVLSTDNANKSNGRNNSSINNSCFNCGDNDNKHNLNECPHPKNWERINQARKKFKEQLNASGANQRYHINDKFASFKPGGELSKELRHALGLNSKELPLYIYKMRLLGYPPGWYQEFVIQNDSLSLFTDNGSNSNTIDNNSSIPNIAVKDSMIIEYPGYNTPLKKNMKDEYWKYKVPPIQECQLKHNVLLYLNQLNNPSINVYNNSNMLMDENNKDINNTTDFVDITDHTDDDERLSVEMEIIPNSDEIPLETSYQDSSNKQEQETPPTCSSKNDNDNKTDQNLDVNNIISCDSNDSDDNNTSSSTLSNDMKLSSAISNPIIKEARTPILTKVSGYKALPEIDKFSKDMGPLINFENLADSVGTYNKMKGLLHKVRSTLKNINSS